MQTRIIPANALKIGDVAMIQGYPFHVRGFYHAAVSGGSLGNPRPGFAAELEWTGEGHNPGPGYQMWLATQAADNGSWTIRNE